MHKAIDFNSNFCVCSSSLVIKTFSLTWNVEPLCNCCVRIACVCAGEDRLEVVARDFRVTNSRQELLFAANRKEVVVGADILRVSGETGHFFYYFSSFKTQFFEGDDQEPIAI
jgi:hypothetical protein